MPGEEKLSAVVANQEANASMAPAAAAASEPASGGNKGKFRVPAEHVKLILALGRDDLPSIDYLDDLAGLYTLDKIAELRRQHQKDLELFKKIDDNFEVYQNEVRVWMQKHGYFEVDYDYLEDKKKINAWTKEQLAKMKIKEINVTCCAADADRAALGYIEYVDSDDDGSEHDDDDDSESEDED